MGLWGMVEEAQEWGGGGGGEGGDIIGKVAEQCHS